MKYPYKKTSFYCCIAFSIAFLILEMVVFDKPTVREVVGLAICVCFVGAIHANDEFSRYVELSDDAVWFGFYRFKKKGQKHPDPPVTFKINYEDIYVLESKKLPIIGVWAINIDATGLHQTVILERSFVNYKEMVKNLCKKAKQHNPKVYIDPELKKYIEEL